MSAIDAEELIQRRRTVPHWSRRIVEQLALVAWVIAKTSGADNAKIENFLLQYGKKKGQSDKQMEMIAEAWIAAMNGE